MQKGRARGPSPERHHKCGARSEIPVRWNDNAGQRSSKASQDGGAKVEHHQEAEATPREATSKRRQRDPKRWNDNIRALQKLGIIEGAAIQRVTTAPALE